MGMMLRFRAVFTTPSSEGEPAEKTTVNRSLLRARSKESGSTIECSTLAYGQ